MGMRGGMIYGAAATLLLCSIVSAVQLLRAQDPPRAALDLGALREPADAASSKGRVIAATRSGSTLPADAWFPSFDPASSAQGFRDPAASRPSRFAAHSASSESSPGGAGTLSTLATGTQAPAEDRSTPARDSAMGGGGAVGGSTGDQARVSRILFGKTQETACQPGRRDLFLKEVRDLYVCVGWQGLAGTYVEGLTFVAPDRNVYQALTVPFTTPGARAPLDAVEMEGRSHDVRPSAPGADGETLVLASLPVAGTYITQRNLVGLWTVEVSLNGQLLDRDHFVLNSGG